MFPIVKDLIERTAIREKRCPPDRSKIVWLTGAVRGVGPRYNDEPLPAAPTSGAGATGDGPGRTSRRKERPGPFTARKS